MLRKYKVLVNTVFRLFLNTFGRYLSEVDYPLSQGIPEYQIPSPGARGKLSFLEVSVQADESAFAHLQNRASERVQCAVVIAFGEWFAIDLYPPAIDETTSF